MRVSETFPNEEEGEDDRTVEVNCTEEGVIIDIYCGDEHLGTWAKTYIEIYDWLLDMEEA